MRISDWSSDVCSSDLEDPPPGESEECEEICGGSESSQTIAYANADGSVEILEAPSGGYPDGYLMEQPVLSRDGSTSAFWSSASNLDPTKVIAERPEERRVGQEGVSTCRTRGSP